MCYSDTEKVMSLSTRKAQVQMHSLLISPTLLTLFHNPGKEGMPQDIKQDDSTELLQVVLGKLHAEEGS